MKRETKEKPFAEVLDELFTRESLPLPLLYRLSDMTPDEYERFLARWPDVEVERRRVLMQHLADISEDNFVVDFTPIFARGLEDEAPAVQVAALAGLWDSTDIKLIGPVKRLLQDEDEKVQAGAAAALAHYVLMAEWGQLPKRVLPGILEALLDVYDDPETAVAVRRAALEALGAAHHPRVPALIAEAYESPDQDVQLSAVFAMGSSANPRWLHTVLAEMESYLPEMRAEAARAAGGIGSSDAISGLANLTVDEDREVRLAAVAALSQIGGDAANEILTGMAEDPEHEDLHEAIDEALAEMTLMTGELELLDGQVDDEVDED